MSKSNINDLKNKVKLLEKKAQQKVAENQLLGKQSLLRQQNINLVRKSIELSDIRRELEDKNTDLLKYRAELRQQNIDLVRKSIELSDMMRQLEDKNFDLELSQANSDRTLDALRKSEEKFRNFLETSTDVVFRMNIAGRVEYVGAGVTQQYGYKPKELIGKHFLKTTPHSERQKILQSFEMIRQGKALRNFEIMQRDKHGRTIPMEINAIPIFEHGEIVGLQGIMRDITDRKRAEEALKASEEKYRQLVENAAEAIFVAQDGRLKFINPATTNMIGYTEKELKSRPFLEFIYPQDREVVTQRHQQRVQGKNVPPSYSFRIVHKDGSVKWVNINTVTIVWESRLATLNFLSDITEQKQAEHLQKVLYEISNAVNTSDDLTALFRSIQMNLGNIIDTTNFFIALYDEHKDTLSLPFMVDECDQFTAFPAGKTLTAFVIKHDVPLMAKEEEIAKMVKQGIVELVGTPCKIWVGVPLKIGKKVIGAVVVQSYTNANLYSKEHLEILKFVSDQIALAIERKKAEEQIRKSLQEKDVLLSEIHHRVKNNLQIISSLLYLQSQNIVDENTLRLFKDSQSRVKSMALIHENLYQSKDFARIDFAEYIQTLTNYLLQTYSTNGWDITVKVDIEDVTLPLEKAIPCGLIINELVSNSFKYAFSNLENGEIYIGLTSKNGKHLTNNEPKKLILSVSDNGRGLPKNFDFQSTKSLGLQLVNNLSKQLHGTIKIQRKKGTRFIITFPE